MSVYVTYSNSSGVKTRQLANDKQHNVSATAQVDISGTYRIKEAYENDRLVSKKNWYNFRLEIKAYSGDKHSYIRYKLTYKLGNTLYAHMKVENGIWKIENDGQTRQSVGGEEAKAEKFILRFERTFNKVKVQGNAVILFGKHGNRIVLAKAKAYEQKGAKVEPVNCMYKNDDDELPMNDGHYFWEFRLIKGTAAIGIATADQFKSGHSIRGLFYDRILTDGFNKLSDFGDEVKQKDRIALFVILSKNSLLLYIFHNKRPLGLAANISSPYPKPLFPVISVSETAKIKIIRSDGTPEKLKREYKPGNSGSILGLWRIMRCEQNGNVVSTQLWKSYTFEITEKKTFDLIHFFNIHTQIVNRISATLVQTPAKWWLLQGSSYLAGVQGEKQKIEDFIFALFGDFTDLKLDKKTLTLFGARDTKIVFIRKRNRAPTPLFRYPL
ncbi:hypothetical protein B4U80_13147 [Leptotrombidium deliense]|uniref:Uncharacterized protein n=1 Tax=Leptotrombidium deliense TaxID=299467 RepID=A0A443SC18_9ACAR|nr:hypothetical protein B4U80_13147 [Leptotrombidium deliense]